MATIVTCPIVKSRRSAVARSSPLRPAAARCRTSRNTAPMVPYRWSIDNTRFEHILLSPALRSALTPSGGPGKAGCQTGACVDMFHSMGKACLRKRKHGTRPALYPMVGQLTLHFSKTIWPFRAWHTSLTPLAGRGKLGALRRHVPFDGQGIFTQRTAWHPV